VAERIRFYFDQHVPSAVARGLRRRGVDVLTAQDADRCGASDQDQLQFSTQQGRVFVTFDADFIDLASRGIEHTGIAFCAASKYSIGELIYALLLVDDTLQPDDMLNHVEFL
jgi:uncharacterized protein with PIN domain